MPVLASAVSVRRRDALAPPHGVSSLSARTRLNDARTRCASHAWTSPMPASSPARPHRRRTRGRRPRATAPAPPRGPPSGAELTTTKRREASTMVRYLRARRRPRTPSVGAQAEGARAAAGARPALLATPGRFAGEGGGRGRGGGAREVGRAGGAAGRGRRAPGGATGRGRRGAGGAAGRGRRAPGGATGRGRCGGAREGGEREVGRKNRKLRLWGIEDGNRGCCWS
ncbi:hypothetical protein GQ55_6G060100 [Panicum hallii var. hallii]|uniref:Uncharacterized protein n=1 Tax=Panicum hallii var. hallii TaxID=1504633 RepID=A0A2T7D4E3_9POAL|nr:hypothetical protein GQ55_6G060100 [Panicum hallii var. hallii]